MINLNPKLDKINAELSGTGNSTGLLAQILKKEYPEVFYKNMGGMHDNRKLNPVEVYMYNHGERVQK